MSRSPLLPKQLQSSPSTHRHIIYSSGTIFLVFFYTGTILPSALTVAPLLTWEICPFGQWQTSCFALAFLLLWKLQVSHKMLSLNSKPKFGTPELGDLAQPEFPLLEASQFWDQNLRHHNWALDHCPADISSSLGLCGHHNSPNWQRGGQIHAIQRTIQWTSNDQYIYILYIYILYILYYIILYIYIYIYIVYIYILYIYIYIVYNIYIYTIYYNSNDSVMTLILHIIQYYIVYH